MFNAWDYAPAGALLITAFDIFGEEQQKVDLRSRTKVADGIDGDISLESNFNEMNSSNGSKSSSCP